LRRRSASTGAPGQILNAGEYTWTAEVAAPIAFLASGRAGNIAGVNYVIDGGLIKTT
jgi:NAD(P)-dependent dehydrogenase (short-subunit alcohol dehydrogenase family)